MTITKSLIYCFILSVSINQNLFSQSKNDAPLSKNAPKDTPTKIIGEEEMKKFDKQIAPFVKQARATLPTAKKKFLAGLNKGEAFFLTIRLFDRDGQWEQVFIRVKEWNNNTIKGYIDSEKMLLKDYKTLQDVEFNESKIMDWLITKPDGAEEGNYVGKYLDTLH